MKAVILLALLVVALAFVPEANGWGRFFRRVGRGIVRIVKRTRTYKRAKAVYDLAKRLGKRGADLSEDEFLNHLATRDISELVDVSKITDAELAELRNAQRETRAVIDELDGAESEEHH